MVEKLTRSPQRRIAVLRTGSAESAHAEPRAIGEAHAPRSFPASIGTLAFAQETLAAVDSRRNLSLKAITALALRAGGQSSPPERQTVKRSCGALGIRVIDHDVAEHMRRVEQLQPTPAPLSFIGGPAAVAILPAEQQLDGIEDAILGKRRQARILQHQRSGQTFGGAVSDRPAVRAIGKWPAATARVPVVALVVRQIFQNLIVDHEPVGPLQSRAMRLPQRRVQDCLRSERRVPQRGRVVAIHLGAVVPVAQIAGKCGETAVRRVTLRCLKEVHKRVEYGVDRSNPDELGGAVLKLDVIEKPCERALAQPARMHALEPAEYEVDDLERKGRRRVDIARSNAVAMLGEADAVVGTIVEFAPESVGEIVGRHSCPHAIKVRHGQIDLPAVAPEAAGMKRQALGQKPQFRQDRLQSVVFVEIKQREGELAPACARERGAVGVDERAGSRDALVIGGKPEQAKCHVAQDRCEQAVRAFRVQAKAAVGVLGRRKIGDHAIAGLGFDASVANVAGSHIHRQKKHRSTIIAAPRTVGLLLRG